MSLQFAYPVYFIAFCLLAGAVYAFLMYYNRYFGERNRFWSFPNWLLATFRFLSVSLIAFLLLSPFIKSYYKEVQEPVVAVAMDNSASILLNRDSTYYRDTFTKAMKRLVSRLENSYQVKTYAYGSQVSNEKELTYEARASNLSKPLEKIYDDYYNRNLGAIILASDGIYNQGQPPMSVARKLQSPIYTIAMGDTIPPKDWLIRRIQHNDIVYAGSKFPVEIQVQAESFKGKSTDLTIKKAGKQVFQQSIRSGSDDLDTTIKAFFRIEEPGLKSFKAILETEDGEVSQANNTRSFYIEALKSKRKVAVIAQHPHPDVGVIKQALKSRKRYTVSTFTLDQWQKANEEMEGYDVFVFHQLPASGGNGRELLRRANKKAIPTLYILGNKTAFSALNQLNLGFAIERKSSNANQVQADLKEGFNAFSISKSLKKLLPQLPPVNSPLASYRLNAPSNTLLQQKIGEVISQKPLFTFLTKPNHKVGIFTATGLWRWYLNEYRVLDQHEAIPNFLAKSVQYLAVDAQKRRFRLVNKQNQYLENERIRFQAEFYNESYEPVRDATISIAISNQKGDTYDFDFTSSKDGYQVEVGYLPVGKYDFTAEASYGDETFRRSGSFVVKPVNKEHLTTVANHALLKNLASENNGKLVYAREINNLPDKLEKSGQLKRTSKREYELKELIHAQMLFWALVLLLGGEWFFRKYYGGY